MKHIFRRHICGEGTTKPCLHDTDDGGADAVPSALAWALAFPLLRFLDDGMFVGAVSSEDYNAAALYQGLREEAVSL